MKNFLLGTYLTGLVFTFFVVGFFTVLGGNSGELWRPFVYSIIWPVFWLFLFFDFCSLFLGANHG